MINLLPPDYKRSMSLEEKLIITVIISAIVSVMIIGGSFHYRLVSANNLLEEQISMAEGRLNQINHQVREINYLERKIREAKEEIEARDDSLGRDLNWILVLDEFRRIVPEDSWVESFEVSNKVFNLRGYTLNQGSLNKIINNLRGSNSFEGIRLVSSNKRNVSYTGFREEETFYFEIVGRVADVRGGLL